MMALDVTPHENLTQKHRLDAGTPRETCRRHAGMETMGEIDRAEKRSRKKTRCAQCLQTRKPQRPMA
jgi:hypothetical protein